MAYIIPNDATHALVLRIDFSDGGEPEESILQFGSFASCDQAAQTLPAVSYSGSRPAATAMATVFELNPYCADCAERHPVGDHREVA